MSLDTVAFNHFQFLSHLTDNAVVVYYKDRRRLIFREIIGVNVKIVRNTNTVFGKKVEFLNVMSGGTYNIIQLQTVTMFDSFHKAKLRILSQYTRISQGLPFFNSSAANDNHSLSLFISWVKVVCAPYELT